MGEVFFKKITGETIISAILNVLLVHPFFEKYSLTFNGLSWYLAVTFFLYFIGYFLVKLVDDKRFNEKYFIVIILVLISGINLCNRCIGTLYIYCNPFYRVLDFLLGMLIAKLFLKNTYQIKNTNKIEISIVFVFILQYLLSFIVGDNPGYYSILFTVALYVFAQGGGVVSKILSLNVFEIISKYSFEFYMFHELMLRILRKVFVNFSFWYPIQCVVIAIPALACTILCVYLYTRLKTCIFNKRCSFFLFD